MSIGGRDALLFEVYTELCGPDVSCETVCLSCGERLEFSFRIFEIYTPNAARSAIIFPFQAGNFDGQFRLPTSADLLTLTDRTPGAARAELVSKCLVSATPGVSDDCMEAMPPKVIDRISEEMGRADPQADIHLSLMCPACSNAWDAPFDIASFMWREIDTWARQVTQEVHWLATAYGWSEREILSMSQARRRAYIQLIGE